MRYAAFNWYARGSRLARLASGTLPLVCLALLTGSAAAQRSEYEADVRRLAPAVDLRPGQTIADIGAGGGELAFALAREVGTAGRVYATEIDEDRLKRLRERAAGDALANVTVVDGHATRTNLPAASCDVIVVRNVYHHFESPEAMNRSLFESLKPGGRLAIIDFRPRGPTAEPSARDGGNHGVDPDTVVRELTAAGFERVSLDGTGGRTFMAVFRRP